MITQSHTKQHQDCGIDDLHGLVTRVSPVRRADTSQGQDREPGRPSYFPVILPQIYSLTTCSLLSEAPYHKSHPVGRQKASERDGNDKMRLD